MECGDYKGTIDFLDDFNRSQKTFKAFRTIINNIKEDSLSKVLNDKVVITDESLFIETKKEKDQIENAIKSVADLNDIDESAFNILLNGALNKTRDGYIIIKR